MFPLYGRANIFFGAVVFGLAFNYRFGSTVSFVLALPSVIFLLLFSGMLHDYLMARTNFSSGLESARTAMLADYWGALDLRFLLLGGDLSKVPSIAEYGEIPIMRSCAPMHSLELWRWRWLAFCFFL